jgi:hypothetical protein
MRILGLPYIVISIRWCICIRYCFAYDPLNPVDHYLKRLRVYLMLKSSTLVQICDFCAIIC